MIVVIKSTSCLNMHEFTNAKISPYSFIFLSAKERKIAAPAWIRTRDLMVNSHTLCHLSHGGFTLLVEGLEPSAFGS